jgi:hypothetical protein
VRAVYASNKSMEQTIALPTAAGRFVMSTIANKVFVFGGAAENMNDPMCTCLMVSTMA